MKTINFHGHSLVVPDAVIKVRYDAPCTCIVGYDAQGKVIFELQEALGLNQFMTQTYEPVLTIKDFPDILKNYSEAYKEVIYFGMPLRVAKEVKYIATDEDGCVIAYTEKPSTGDYGWYSLQGKHSTLFFMDKDIPFWKEALQEYM